MKDLKVITLFIIFIIITKDVNGARPRLPRCLDVNRVAWRNFEPFFVYQGDNYTSGGGIVEKIFNMTLRSCCIGDLVYSHEFNFESQDDLSDILLNERVKSTFEYIFPVQRTTGSNNFLIYPFVPLVVSPGLALFSVPQKGGAEAIFHSIKGIIPFLVLMSLCVGIAGTVFWMIENMTLAWYGERPERFSKGVVDGIWWAFVTMTTVGYGDIIPKTKPGRVFSVLWVFVGLVFCGFTISSITTGIILSITKKEIELLEQNVAVLRGSEEFRYVTKKQGYAFEFDSIEEIAESLRTETIKIALIDTMVAGHFQEALEGFELNKIIESMTTVGVIFLNDGSKFAKCARNYIYDKQQEVLNEISQSVRIVKFSPKSGGDSFLIDPSLPVFRIGLISMSGTLIFFIVCGVSKDWYAKCCKKPQEKKSVKELREEHKDELINTFTDIKSTCENFIFEIENKC